jgi:outer membrane receptor for ferric coprogen and ferric-rhodotorulic acid
MSITNELWRRGRRAGTTNAFPIRLTPLGLALCAAWAGAAHAQQALAGPNAGSTLPAIVVNGTPDATTEDSGSYAARNATVAGKVAVPLKETPASVSVLTRERMNDQNMTTIQEALRYVTGVTSVDYGDGTAYFRARGNQLGVEFDGVPLVSGLQYQQQFDLAMYDRIEVLRGPAGVMDGMGEPGGTVDLVRKRPQDQFHVSTETQIGSFGSVRQIIDVTGPLNKDGTVRGRAVLVGSDGLQSTDGTRDKEVMAYGAIDWDITPRTTLSLSAAYQVNPISGLDYGAPGVLDSTGTNLVGRVPSSYSQNFSPSWNSAFTSTQEANANLVHKFDNGWQSSTSLFYRHELMKSSYAYAGNPGATADGYSWYGDQRQRNAYDWFGADTHVSGPIQAFGRTHTLTIGANYSLMSDTELYGYTPVNGPGPDGMFSLFDANSVPQTSVPYGGGSNNRLEQYGVYAQARIRVADPVTLVLGAREAFLQERSQSIVPTVDDWQTVAQVNHRFLPSAGIVWDVVPWATAYAGYARFLTPQDDTTATGGLLAPRSGEQYEVGLKTSFLGGRLSTTTALFRINDDNRAIQDPNNAFGSIPGGKARDQGVEFEVTGQPTPNWNVYAGYTYLATHFENDTPNLTDGTDPKHLFKLWTDYKFTQGPLNKFSIGGGMLAQSSISRGVTQGGYAIFNAQVGYRFNKHVQASLQLNNIFNRDYYMRPPGNFFSVFGDKRNMMLTVRSDF